MIVERRAPPGQDEESALSFSVLLNSPAHFTVDFPFSNSFQVRDRIRFHTPSSLEEDWRHALLFLHNCAFLLPPPNSAHFNNSAPAPCLYAHLAVYAHNCITFPSLPRSYLLFSRDCFLALPHVRPPLSFRSRRRKLIGIRGKLCTVWGRGSWLILRRPPGGEGEA